MFDKVVEYIAKRADNRPRLGLNIKQTDKILIVAPHPDDESIACGGILSLYGRQCDVLLITDGGAGNPEWDYDYSASVRREEFFQAMSLAKVNNIIEFRAKNNQYNRLKKIKIKFNLGQYNQIFIPSRNEGHKEHILTNKIMLKGIREQHCKVLVYEYEVWTPLNNVTDYLDISDCIEKKNEMINKYKCQLKHIDYISAINGLNAYRGMQFHVKYAEAYERYKSVYEKKVDEIFICIDKFVQKMLRIFHFIKGTNK